MSNTVYTKMLNGKISKVKLYANNQTMPFISLKDSFQRMALIIPSMSKTCFSEAVNYEILNMRLASSCSLALILKL